MILAQAFEKPGIEKDIQQDIQKGEAALITHEIQRRFDNAPNIHAQQIDQADT